MSATALEEPVIIQVQGWVGDQNNESVLVLGWSEMDHGPIPTEFSRGVPVADGMWDENGLLVGGLYVMDYERGQADFRACKPRPKAPTMSYDLGRQKAAEEECDRLAILAHMVALPGLNDVQPA